MWIKIKYIFDKELKLNFYKLYYNLIIYCTMNNYLYKIFKYCDKLHNYNSIKYITPFNTKEIYLQNKSLYKNQKGGELVVPETLKNIDIIQTIYHGSLTNISFIIPDNIYLIIPLCCGFYNYAIDAYSQFFTFQTGENGEIVPYEQINDYIKKNINVAENIIKIGYNNYIILRPSTEYCDILLQIDYNTKIGTIPIGIFDSVRYKFKMKIHRFDEYDYNSDNKDDNLCEIIDDKKRINAYNGLLYMEKIRTKNWEYLLVDIKMYKNI